MSEADQRKAYERFAAETYAIFRESIGGAVRSAPRGQDVLIVVGDDHLDTPFKTLLVDPNDRPEDREPALAGAFSQISALEAGIRAVGKDNVKLSVELDAAKLKSFTDAIRANDGNVPPQFQDFPMIHTIAFAMRHEIPIIPNDPLHATADGGRDMDNEDRERALIRGIISTGDKDDQKTTVVVHVGGTEHLSNMLGYTDQEVTAAGGQIEAQGDRNPFNGTYASAHYFNPTRFSPAMLTTVTQMAADTAAPEDFRARAQYDLAEHVFFTNPHNAIQIDAPGVIPDDVVTRIAEMVQEAARKQEQSSPVSPAAALSAPAITPSWAKP